MNRAWALLRLASPQLPIGGYSYSQGLEMAVEQGLIHDAKSASHWLSDQLLFNLARYEAPLLLAHCQAAAEQDWPLLHARSEEHRASRETRELHQESRQMGYSLRQLLTGLPELDQAARDFLEPIAEPHLALGWALAARGLADRAGRRPGCLALELAGKPVGRADEDPAPRPASRTTPDQ
jgi:urease accessory protein